MLGVARTLETVGQERAPGTTFVPPCSPGSWAAGGLLGHEYCQLQAAAELLFTCLYNLFFSVTHLFYLCYKLLRAKASFYISCTAMESQTWKRP